MRNVYRALAGVWLVLHLAGRVSFAGDEVTANLKAARLRFAQLQLVAGAKGQVRQGDKEVGRLEALAAETRFNIQSCQVIIDKYRPRVTSGEKEFAIKYKLLWRQQLNELNLQLGLLKGQTADREDRRELAEERRRLERQVNERFRELRDSAAAEFGKDRMDKGVAQAMMGLGWRSGVEDALGLPDDFWSAYREFVLGSPVKAGPAKDGMSTATPATPNSPLKNTPRLDRRRSCC